MCQKIKIFLCILKIVPQLSKKSNVITLEETKETELKSKEDGTASEKLEGTGFSKEVLESNNVKSTESAAVSFDNHPKENVSFKWFNFYNFRTLNTFDVCELCLINSWLHSFTEKGRRV